MQHTAGPDLPHTHTRPVHWLSTAAALAVVLAGASLVRPAPATADSTTGHRPPSPAATTAPDPHGVTYPLHCGSDAPDVIQHAAGDLDGDGRPETVAVVRCPSGIGTPPSGVYVLAPARDGVAARIAATLVAPAQQINVEHLVVRGGAVSATLLGYSTTDVPRCCPDVRSDAKWRWSDGKFVQSEHPAAHSAPGPTGEA